MSYNVRENARKYRVQEIEFAALAAQFGDVSFSTLDEDIHEHWDVKLINKGNTILFDVKGMKKRNREDDTADDSIHYVELFNVSGKKGWLYGNADCFAFETTDQYIVVEKKRLQDFIAEKCKDKVHSNKPELYKLYKRDGRNDLIVLVETSELIKISKRILNKSDVNENLMLELKFEFEHFIEK